MTTKQKIEEFLNQKSIGIVGISKDERKFGNNVYKAMKTAGFNVHAVHPEIQSVAGEKCYPDFNSLPEKPGGVWIAVAPKNALAVLQNVSDAGIKNVWLQRQSESEEAIDFCIKNGINVISKECILMHAEPVKSIHRFHRGINKLFGMYPR